MASELAGRLRELGGLVYESGIFSDTAICFDAASALAASEAQVSTLSRQLEEAREALNYIATCNSASASDLKQVARRAKETVSHG